MCVAIRDAIEQSSSAPDKEVIIAQATKDAVDYFRSLPHGEKIYVWPTWRRLNSWGREMRRPAEVR